MTQTSVPESTGSVKTHGRYKFVTADLVSAKGGNQKAAALVVEAMEPAILTQAKSWAASSSVERDDLIQAGRLGVLEALERCDPERGAACFVGFARRYIAQAIREAASLSVPGPSVPSRTLAYYFQAEHADVDTPLCDGTIQSVRESLSTVSLSTFVEEGGDGEAEDNPDAFRHRLNGVAPGDGDDDVADPAIVSAALSELPQREADIVHLAFGFTGRAPLTDREIAEELNIDRSRVNRIRNRALGRLREALTEEVA